MLVFYIVKTQREEEYLDMADVKLHGYIIPSNEDLGVLLLDEKQFLPQFFKSNASGLVEEIKKMFSTLREHNVQEFKIHMKLQQGGVSELSNLANPTVFLFRMTNNWHTEEFLRPKEFEQIKKTIGLITYMHIGHFHRVEIDKVLCFLCAEKDHIPFAYNEFKPCTNPKCISHKAEHAINPDYKIPKPKE